jgi:hypothetical protein
MPDSFSHQEQAAIPLVLSQPRFTTYLVEKQNSVLDGLRLYHWNALVSSAFLFPLHIFEICIRNAASNAIESYYNSSQWPWVHAFEISLPESGPNQFSPRRELRNTRARHSTTGKIVADMRFAFWASLFTRRHQGRLWSNYYHREFPNAAALSSGDGRKRIFEIAETARELRNRIAHHEPIFRRNLQADYDVLLEAINYRCSHTAAWVRRAQTVTTLISHRP